jgi:hypothetical protein
MLLNKAITTGRIVRRKDGELVLISHAALTTTCKEPIMGYLRQTIRRPNAIVLAREMLEQGIHEDLEIEKPKDSSKEESKVFVRKIFNSLNVNSTQTPPIIWQKLKIAVGNTCMLDSVRDDDGRGYCFCGDAEDEVLQSSSKRGRCNCIFWEDADVFRREPDEVYNNVVGGIVGRISTGHQAKFMDRVVCDDGKIEGVCSDVGARRIGVVHIIHNDKAVSFENAFDQTACELVYRPIVMDVKNGVVNDAKYSTSEVLREKRGATLVSENPMRREAAEFTALEEAEFEFEEQYYDEIRTFSV